ncbi:MAG: DUF3348 domain-containing protein [Candidatus Accumulibacter phosphatis]|uniref:DUF3348 domain-containing protein n=1 Tax=Candidatus Accumulibacter phosphatis TaxID=327160 RepID=UPI001A4627C2|nr:DUF3348 domain-containing protein [Candidatus Accumulibacter phosphatis]
MTQAVPRINFNRSKLVRLLADLSIVDVAESKPDFAERLSQWLDLSDAITLHAAQNASAASSSAAPSCGQSVAAVAVEEEYARVRTALVNSITTSCSSTIGETRMKLPPPEPDATIDIAAANQPAYQSAYQPAYQPFRRLHLAQQASMEASVRELRSSVRQALARASAPLRQLAALDEVLDNTLCVREHQLLATVPLLLERRFEQLLKAHQQPLADTRQADSPAARPPPPEWLSDFCRELQGVLLAELDLRLQPTAGLIEALRNEANEVK